MSNRLGVRFDELTRLAKNSDKDISISSMCTVFAESEIISLIAQNVSRENIAKAVIVSAINKNFEFGQKTGKYELFFKRRL